MSNTISSCVFKYSEYGIFFNSSSNNLCYNNYLSNNKHNAYDEGHNKWNTSKKLGINIIGSPYLGGNYWSDYNGTDTNKDGLGNTNLPYGPGDYLPLVEYNNGGGGGDGGETPNNAPIANFSYSPSNPTVNNTILFTDISSDSDGTIASWSWSFGDGTNSTSKNPQHNYSTPGQYTIFLEITDNDGAKKSISKILTISQPGSPNIQPTANFSFYPSTAKINETIQFTDTSIDTDGTITSYLWNFGDGTNSTSKNPQHKYTTNGTYSITLEIIDNDGATDFTSKAILVNKDSTDTNGSKGTPSFEIIIAIGAIALVMLWKRKRSGSN